MTSRTATLSASDKVGSWKMVGQKGMTGSKTPSNGHQKRSKIVLGLVTLGVSERRQTECQLYQRGRCHYGDQCKYVHVLREESHPVQELAITSARHTNAIAKTLSNTSECDVSNMAAESSNSERMTASENSNSYPVRNGAADCQYYLKTGKCNYGSRCKFNHPFRDESLVNALNRRDCFDFVQTGTCPYGKSCKYNHPTTFEDLHRNLKHQPTATSNSSNSSPRSVPRTGHRRASSEPRYSSRRDTLEGSSRPSKLQPIGDSHTRRPQSSKWESSPESASAFANNLVKDATTLHVVHNHLARQIADINPNARENPWAGDIRRPANVGSFNAQLTGPSERASGFLPAVSAIGGRQHPSQHAVLSHTISHMTPPFMRSPEFELGGEVVHAERRDSNIWHTPDHFANRDSDQKNPVAPVRALLGTGDFLKNSQPDMRFLRSSIWTNEYSIERKGNTNNVTASSLDYRRPSRERIVPTTVPEMSAVAHMFQVQEKETLQTRSWTLGSRGQQNNVYFPNTATSMPLPPTPGLYSGREELPSSHDIAATMERTQPLPSALGIHCQKGSMAPSLQEVTRLRQIHLQKQNLSQKHVEQHAKMQQLERHSRTDEFWADSTILQGLAEKRLPSTSSLTHCPNNYGSEINLPNIEVGCALNEECSLPGFDPMAYKALPLDPVGSKDLDSGSMSNVWKTSEKSMFGPSLFGMQHRA